MSTIETKKYDKNLNEDDYDSLLIQQLKNNRKVKEKERFTDEYMIDYEEEEDTEGFIEGYDIELPEEEEYEEELYNMPKKGRKKKRKDFYDEFGIESEFYESDYNIGDYE